MDIIFKGRRTDVQERFREHAVAKLGKVEKLDHKAIRVDVEVSQERNPRLSDQRERVELTIRSRGPVIRAEAAAEDRYTAFDLALAKLETRLRRSGERRKARRSPRAPDRNGASRPAAAGLPGAGTGEQSVGSAVGAADDREPAAASLSGDAAGGDRAEPAPAGAGGGTVIPIQMEGDGPVVVREKYHAATPMGVEQALLEMELVGHDFFVFRDEMSGYPSVVYRRRGYQYGVIRLIDEQARSGGERALPAEPSLGGRGNRRGRGG